MARKRTSNKASEGEVQASPSKPFRLGVVTKLWGRPAITAFVLGYLRGLSVPGVEVVCAAAYSPDDPQPADQVEGWAYAEAPNRPLSAKGNAAVQMLRALHGDRIDAVLNVGSDDIVSPAYVAEAVRLIREGADVVLPDGLCLFDVEKGEAIAVRAPRIGAGRVVSSAVLDKLDWNLWPEKGEMPDADMDAQFKKVRGLSKKKVPGADLAAGLVVLDIKGHDNIGSFDEIKERRGKTGEASEIDPAEMWAALGVDPQGVAALQSGYREDRTPVRMKALVNVPASMVEGRSAYSRVIRRGSEFACPPERVRELVRVGYARKAEDA